MGSKVLCFFPLAIQLSLSGCLGLAIYEDDNPGVVTGKVFARTLLALPTLGFSEAALAEEKRERENSAFIVTNGSHPPRVQPPPPPNERKPVVIWGNHPAANSTATTLVQKFGDTVVERSRINQVLEEQKFRLTYSSESEADLLKVGQLVGASRIIFIEVETDSKNVSESNYVSPMIIPGKYPIFLPGGGGSYSYTVYHVSVSVRGVSVEDGTIRWSGTATTNKPINNPEPTVGFLTEAAIRRAICPTENDYDKNWMWIEQGPWRKRWGCWKKLEESP